MTSYLASRSLLQQVDVKLRIVVAKMRKASVMLGTDE
jgi:hypothetical protein